MREKMNNVLKILLTICLIIGISGCMQASDEENAQNVEAMLNYINTKYDETFEAIEYIPGEEGLNDFANQNTLIARNDIGMTIMVTEFLGLKGEYQDNYQNMLLSYLFKKELEKEIGLENLNYIKDSRFYVSGDISDIDVEELKKNFSKYILKLKSIKTFIYINVPIESINIEDIYNLYTKINSYNTSRNIFSIGFEGDINKSKEYLEKYDYIGEIKTWYEYDKNLTTYMSLPTESNLTFEEFKNKLYEGKLIQDL